MRSAGFHFFLFLALRLAPPVEANLVNYLWPLLIVVLAPVLVPGIAWSTRHALGAVVGFSGAALLIGSGAANLGEGSLAGYAFALACHGLFEPAYGPTAAVWPYVVALGVGPMGAAFFLWDRALKTVDPRVLGNLAYLTPLLSTLLLVASGSGEFRPQHAAGHGPDPCRRRPRYPEAIPVGPFNDGTAAPQWTRPRTIAARKRDPCRHPGFGKKPYLTVG